MEPARPDACSDGEDDAALRDDSLPISNICKIMRTVLDENLKISREAKILIEECVTEFICFVTSEASDKCQREKRKTINAEDILTVMKQLGFDNYVYILQPYLFKYKDAVAKMNKEVEKNLVKKDVHGELK